MTNRQLNAKMQDLRNQLIFRATYSQTETRKEINTKIRSIIKQIRKMRNKA